MGDQIINILFSTDENYAQHVGASIASISDNNQKKNKINFFILENRLSMLSKNRLECIVNSISNCSIIFIPFNQNILNVSLNPSWSISLSSYARILCGRFIPNCIDRIIYMDCDMIACEDLSELWNFNLNGNIIGAVQDTVSSSIKRSIGVNPTDRYFNAGLLLIDLVKWRESDIDNKCLKFLADRNGSVIHHDQGILNGVLKDKWIRLPLKYNVMTIHYMFNLKQIKKYFKDESEFYSEAEVEDTRKNPVILHYTPSFTSRPWVKGCKHPFKHKYFEALANTPWCGAVLQNDKSKLAIKLVNWWYRNFKI